MVCIRCNFKKHKSSRYKFLYNFKKQIVENTENFNKHCREKTFTAFRTKENDKNTRRIKCNCTKKKSTESIWLNCNETTKTENIQCNQQLTNLLRFVPPLAHNFRVRQALLPGDMKQLPNWALLNERTQGATGAGAVVELCTVIALC